MESHRILEDHFPGPERHGNPENDDNVMEFLQLH